MMKKVLLGLLVLLLVAIAALFTVVPGWVEKGMNVVLNAPPYAASPAAQELHKEVAAANPLFKKVHDSLMSFTKTTYQWHQVAELGYDSFMVRKARG